MSYVRVTSRPPGLAPDHIRDEWVGVLMPRVVGETAERVLARLSPDSPAAGGYVVRGPDAIAALLAYFREEAATYWTTTAVPPYLVFPRDNCDEVPQGVAVARDEHGTYSVWIAADEGTIASHFGSNPFKTFEIPCGQDGLWTLDQLRRSEHPAAEQAIACIEAMVNIGRSAPTKSGS